MPSATQTEPSITSFEHDLAAAFDEIRRTIGRALGAAACDPAEPQEVARRLGVNRQLTWRISKVVCSPDLVEAVAHMPGAEGMDILLTASSRLGAHPDTIAAVRAALQRFDEVVRVHAGDRASLDLMLESLGAWSGEGAAERSEQSRRLAFRGNSAVWGVQTRVRVNLNVIAPCPDDPKQVDTALVGGIVGFRRLREGVRWPLFRPRFYNEDGTPRQLPGEIAIDPDAQGSPGPKLIRAFCSPGMPPVLERPEGRGVVYEIGDGPVGNTGAFTCFFGTIIPSSAPRHASGAERHADLFTQVTMPAESMLFDVLVHRSLGLGAPELAVQGHLATAEPGTPGQTLPILERIRELPGSPPIASTPLIPRYEELVRAVHARAGWDPKEFRGFRLSLRYPPMHATAMMRFTLPGGEVARGA